MRVELSEAEQRLTVVEKGGLAFIAALSAIVSAFALLILLVSVVDRLDASLLKKMGASLFGMLVAVAAIAAFGRRGVTIDLRSDTAVVWWRVLVPIWRKALPLGRFHQVSLTHEWRFFLLPHVFKLRLVGDCRPLVLAKFPADKVGSSAPLAEKYAANRSIRELHVAGKQVARFCGLPFTDDTRGDLVTTDENTLSAAEEPAVCLEVDGAVWEDPDGSEIVDALSSLHGAASLTHSDGRFLGVDVFASGGYAFVLHDAPEGAVCISKYQDMSFSKLCEVFQYYARGDNAPLDKLRWEESKGGCLGTLLALVVPGGVFMLMK